MSNINVYLRENIGAISTKNMTVAPNIPEKKINNGVKAFGYSGSVVNVIGLYDNTLFGSGKDGLLFTGEQVIYRASFSEPIGIHYVEIVSAEYVETVSGEKNDKITLSVLVVKKDGSRVVIENMLDCDYKKLAEVLQTTIRDFDDYKEEQQFVPIDEMSEALKVSYIKVIINMAYDNDGVIDNREFAEILLLMTRLSLSPESRFSLRSYMANSTESMSLEQLISLIEAECTDGQIKSVHVSLTKDLINTYLSSGGDTIGEFAFLNKNRHLIKVTDDEIALTQMAIQNDHNMLKEDISDDQIVGAMKELSAKAAAVGTPLAAVYLSGSVIGMSAAGLTSGLATLGIHVWSPH